MCAARMGRAAFVRIVGVLLLALSLLAGCSGTVKLFAVTRIEAPSYLAFGNNGPVSIYWLGNPEFPVSVRTRVVACSGITCNSVDYTVTTRENPIRGGHSCYGSGAGGTGTWSVTLVDASGFFSNQAEYTVTCY
jgi:hypothetical protein